MSNSGRWEGYSELLSGISPGARIYAMVIVRGLFTAFLLFFSCHIAIIVP